MRSESFDSLNGSYLDRLIWGLRARNVRRRIRRREIVIADLGCGRTAPLLRQLLESGHASNAVGADLEPDMSHETACLKFIKADLNKPLPIGDGTFDLVLSLAVLEHLTQPAIYLSEAHRILKPGGTLLLTTPSPGARPVLEFMAYRLKIIDRREIEDHKMYYDRRMLIEALTAAGFEASGISAKTFQFGLNNSVEAIR